MHNRIKVRNKNYRAVYGASGTSASVLCIR